VLAAVKMLDAFAHRCRRSVVWGGKGIEGMGEWSDVGVLRLRLSQRAREASLRMTELEVGSSLLLVASHKTVILSGASWLHRDA
jgi:hypothetical protein